MNNRPDSLPSVTYKLKIPTTTDAFYITICDIDRDGKIEPYELFINTKNLAQLAIITTMTRLISGMFRQGISSDFVIKELKSIFDPDGGFFLDNKHIPSLSSAIGLVLEKHVGKTKTPILVTPIEEETNDIYKHAKICPKCNAKALIMEGGCNKCLDCSWSQCG